VFGIVAQGQESAASSVDKTVPAESDNAATPVPTPAAVSDTPAENTQAVPIPPDKTTQP